MCDPQLPQLKDPHGYYQRGDRCEGLYIKEVGGSSAISLVSLTRSFEDYDLTSGKDLLLQWKSPAQAEAVHVRAVGLRQRLYYRMDTMRPGGATSYLWKTGVLAGLTLKRKDLGVTAWIPLQVGSEKRDVYLPLEVGQGANASTSGGYEVTLLPSSELNEVFLTLAPVGSDGRTGAPLLSAKKLGYGYYPAQRAISVPISNLGQPGIYQLDLGANLQTGQPSTLRLWFYHSLR
jgi:hypothetical protein